MTERRGEPRRWVVLAAFVAVSLFADVSPLLKLRPFSPAFGALVGAPDEKAASLLFAAFVAVTLAAPAVAVLCVVRTRLLPTGWAARGVSALFVLVLWEGIRKLGHKAEQLQAIGGGSDQAACITMPARALATGHWPYDRALIWSGNACSPGVGWIALAVPFVLLLGYSSFLVAGAAAFVVLPDRLLGARSVTAMLVLVLSCVAAWQSLVTGADDLAIGIAFALLTALSALPRLTIAVAIGAGLVATARLPFAFFPFVLAAQIYAGGARGRAAKLGLISLSTLALVHGAPLAINGASYVADGPLHVLGKGERIADAGGLAFFVASGLAWLAYAAVILRRPPTAASLQFRVATLTLLCVAGPALADLAARQTPEALGGWQGGNWLLAALPCYAASVAITFSDRARLRPPR